MTNAAALGYTIMAGKKLGLSKEELDRLITIMYGLFDLITEDEAEGEYRLN